LNIEESREESHLDEESPECEREIIKAIERPMKNNFAGGRIRMSAKNAAKANGCQTHDACGR